MKYPKLVLKEKEEEGVVEIDPKRLFVNIRNIEEFIEIREGGNFAKKAFWLNPCDVEWIKGRDKNGCIILVPLKKEEWT